MRENISTNTPQCRVGNFDVFPGLNTLRKEEVKISVEPRVMDVFYALIKASGDVVSREKLLDDNWDAVHGADESLTRVISILRKTLREAGEEEPYIQTISKRGYRISQPIDWSDNGAEIDEDHPNVLAESEQGHEHKYVSVGGEDSVALSLPQRLVGLLRVRKWLIASFAVIGLFVSSTLLSNGSGSFFPIETDPAQASVIDGSIRSKINIDANSIAVLPFLDMSAAHDQEYFSDGISEEILNVLARVEGLSVASRTSSFQFKGRSAVGIPAIANELRVRYVLQGSVRKAGDTIRITTQLIEASTDQHLWSSTFDRTLTTENLFAIQEEIANETVAALSSKINRTIGNSPSLEVKTSSVDAYEYFLKARALYQNRMSIHEAERLLLDSITLDPDFADAWALRSAVYIVVYAHGQSFGADSQADREQSRIFAQKALEMQPENVLALASLAFSDMLDLLEGQGNKSFADVIAAFNRALEVDANSIDVLNWRGIQMMRAGYFELAITDYARCIEIDRAAAPCRYNLMAGYAMNGQADQAVRVLFEALDYGAFSQDTLVLLVLSEIERRDLFLFAAGWNPQLRGWHRFGALYDALQSPEIDHTDLRSQLREMFDKNGINSLAEDMLLSALGDFDEGAVGTVWWFKTHHSFRQTAEFKQQIKDVGIYDYWVVNGFPPQCQPIGNADFVCE